MAVLRTPRVPHSKYGIIRVRDGYVPFRYSQQTLEALVQLSFTYWGLELTSCRNEKTWEFFPCHLMSWTINMCRETFRRSYPQYMNMRLTIKTALNKWMYDFNYNSHWSLWDMKTFKWVFRASLNCHWLSLRMPRWEKSTSHCAEPVSTMLWWLRLLWLGGVELPSLYGTGMVFRECLVILWWYSVLLIELHDMLYWFA